MLNTLAKTCNNLADVTGVRFWQTRSVAVCFCRSNWTTMSVSSPWKVSSDICSVLATHTSKNPAGSRKSFSSEPVAIRVLIAESNAVHTDSVSTDPDRCQGNKAGAERNWISARRDPEAGEEHQGPAWHVPVPGHGGGGSGEEDQHKYCSCLFCLSPRVSAAQGSRTFLNLRYWVIWRAAGLRHSLQNTCNPWVAYY